jgi:hypothetical protein
MSAGGNFFNKPESISRQMSNRSKVISEAGTLEQSSHNNLQSSLEEEEEESEEEIESEEPEGNENEQSDNQVELTKGLEGLHLGEE